jgi:23S rRNA (guanosine2251-2'-O)-methyltransferase
MKNFRGKRPENRERPARRNLRPREDADPKPPNAIYGVLPVLEALRANPRRIEKIVIAEGAREHRLREILELARAADLLVERQPRERFQRIVAEDANHQGVVAIAAAADYSDADEIFENASPTPLFVLLDSVEDPRNFGAILRTAECAGVDGVFVPERRAAGLTETVAKAAAGATEHVKVAKVQNLNRLIEELKRRDIWVVGTAGGAETDYTEWEWTRPTALVLGGEGGGLHRLVAENCDALVKIPMYGKIDSLNVSVAAGVVLFEARRQRAAVTRQAETRA